MSCGASLLPAARRWAFSLAVEFFAVRLVEEDSETVAVRKGVPQPFSRKIDRGAMVTVIDRGAYGYAATSDLSAAGLQAALDGAALHEHKRNEGADDDRRDEGLRRPRRPVRTPD